MKFDWPKLLAALGALGTLLGGGGYWAGGIGPQEGFDACISIIQTQAETIAHYQRQRSSP